jgi:indolepyruvate ferredoxin oxidoreductase
VTVHGAKLPTRRALASATVPALPEPKLPPIKGTYDIIITGIGGTGVVTIGGVLGMAAHLDGKGVGVIDMAGLAQKGGAVYSHMRIANNPDDIHAIRVAAASAELIIGGDIVVAGTKKVLGAIKPGQTDMVVNLAEFLPGDFTRDINFTLPTERLKRAIERAAGAEKSYFIDATRIAGALLGNSVSANIFLVGYAFQVGALPLTAEAIEHAIELNGEAVEMNKMAFRFGRYAAADRAAVEKLAAPKEVDDVRRLSQSLDEIIARRVSFLTDYQNAAYAARYRALVEKVRAVEAARAPGKQGLAEAVARYLFKLMAYKDEYEVARLYAGEDFARQVRTTFAGDDLRFEFHLAPPLIARKDGRTGAPEKMSFGPWMMSVFRLLAKLKGLRGTAFDPFGYTQERRIERALIADYEVLLAEIVERLTQRNHHLAVGLAAIPEKIRGFGHIKARSLQVAKADEAALLAQFRASAPALLKAAE